MQGHSFPSLKLGLFPHFLSLYKLHTHAQAEKNNKNTATKSWAFKVTFISMIKLIDTPLLLECGYSSVKRNCRVCDCEWEGEQTARMFSSFLLARSRDRSQTTSRGGEEGGSKWSGVEGGEEKSQLDMSLVAVWDGALWLSWRQSRFQGILVHNVILIMLLRKKNMRIRKQFICLCICACV